MRFLDEDNATIENPNGIGIEKYKYNEKGNLLEISEYDKDGNPQGSASIITYYKYQYDEFGRILRIEFFDKANNNAVYPNTKISKVVFKYDASGKAEMKYFDVSGNEVSM
jgi:YD repeat-containing protein